MYQKPLALKATAKEKNLYVKLQNTIELIDEVLLHERRSTSGSHVAFPFAVSHNVSTAEVEQIIGGYGMEEKDKELVREKFDQKGIDHAMNCFWLQSGEFFIHHLNVENSDFLSKILQECKRKWPMFQSGYSRLDRKLNRLKDADSAVRTVKAFFAERQNAHEMLEHVYKMRIYMDCGDVISIRKGDSWVNVVDAEVLKVFRERITGILETYYYNRDLIRLGKERDRKGWWENIDFLLFSAAGDDDISMASFKLITGTCLASLWLLKEGPKYFKKIDYSRIKKELQGDIDYFINEKRILTVAKEEAIQRWMNGAGFIKTDRNRLSYLRVSPLHDRIESSNYGSSIEIETGFELYKRLKAIVEGRTNDVSSLRIGTYYRVVSFKRMSNDYVLNVNNCARIRWDHIKYFAEEYLLPVMMKRNKR